MSSKALKKLMKYVVKAQSSSTALLRTTSYLSILAHKVEAWSMKENGKISGEDNEPWWRHFKFLLSICQFLRHLACHYTGFLGKSTITKGIRSSLTNTLCSLQCCS